MQKYKIILNNAPFPPKYRPFRAKSTVSGCALLATSFIGDGKPTRRSDVFFLPEQLSCVARRALLLCNINCFALQYQLFSSAK
jgi:hypothetical protein